MRIVLIGTGQMGSMVASLAVRHGHEVSASIDETSGTLSASALANKIADCDVAIDFSAANAVRRNVSACMAAGVALVEGTTGWNEHLHEVKAVVERYNGSFVYGANFSIGVNLFYRIVDHAAELFAKFPEYEAFIEEQHHSRKKDAPSGTALKLKDVVSKHIARDLSVSATRAGNIPGTHRIGFDGPADQVLLEHTARSREGFAAGAIMAAEWIMGKKGCYEFGDVMDEILRK
jgi:4-hydroxy-tetrahydrodipicolinate reductase